MKKSASSVFTFEFFCVIMTIHILDILEEIIMKTRKALAVLLAVVMLVVPLAASSYAAPAATIVTPAEVVAYTDTEYFNPQGLVINDGSTDVVYTPSNKDFSFVPALNEPLTVDAVVEEGEEKTKPLSATKEINVFYKNVFCGTVTVTVSHTLTGKLEHIGNGHGEYCLGCGELFNFARHTIDVPADMDNMVFDHVEFDPNFFEDKNIIPNDDGGFFTPQTKTGTCSVCNGKETITIQGSEKFLTIFDNNLTDLEGTVVIYFYQIAVSLIQMLTGIN